MVSVSGSMPGVANAGGQSAAQEGFRRLFLTGQMKISAAIARDFSASSPSTTSTTLVLPALTGTQIGYLLVEIIGTGFTNSGGVTVTGTGINMVINTGINPTGTGSGCVFQYVTTTGGITITIGTTAPSVSGNIPPMFYQVTYFIYSPSF